MKLLELLIGASQCVTQFLEFLFLNVQVMLVQQILFSQAVKCIFFIRLILLI